MQKAYAKRHRDAGTQKETNSTTTSRTRRAHAQVNAKEHRTTHVQRPTCREPPRAQKLTNGVRAETKQNNENIPEERTERRTAYARSTGH